MLRVTKDACLRAIVGFQSEAEAFVAIPPTSRTLSHLTAFMALPIEIGTGPGNGGWYTNQDRLNSLLGALGMPAQTVVKGTRSSELCTLLVREPAPCV